MNTLIIVVQLRYNFAIVQVCVSHTLNVKTDNDLIINIIVIVRAVEVKLKASNMHQLRS